MLRTDLRKMRTFVEHLADARQRRVYARTQSTCILTIEGVVESGHGAYLSPHVPACVCIASSIGSRGTCRLRTLPHTLPSSVYASRPGAHTTPAVCQRVKCARTLRWI